MARLTLDTTGLYHGSWDLRLSDVLPYDELDGPYTTNFVGLNSDIHNGRLTIDVDVGDFNADGLISDIDIDLLAQAMISGETDGFDLAGKKRVDQVDYEFWISTVARTYRGDANLDGRFNSDDLVSVLAAREYEDGIPGNSGWATGDWNGDLEFTGDDLIEALADRGYEQGWKPALAVPEPSHQMWLAFLLLTLIGRLLHRAART